MRHTPPIEQRLEAGPLTRHLHVTAYAALVLDGGYLERGTAGRWRVEAGTVVAHPRFDAHDNEVPGRGARVLNIALPPAVSLPPVFTVQDPDLLIRAVRAGEPDLAALLTPDRVIDAVAADWPDALAAALRCSPVRIGRWAREQGLAAASVTRGFHAAFGVTPARFRAEAQTARALRRITGSAAPLAVIAVDCGFADQAHLSRAVRVLTGRTPQGWRRVKSVQDRTAPTR